MAESSSYKESWMIHRMAHLQGDLQSYESQQLELDEELQRLWPEGVASASSANPRMEPRTSTFTQLAHHSDKSQLVPNANTNLSNLNYYRGNVEEDHRRARNQAILDKIQELETNASIFAARSERLRMMKNEYETLTRKYSSIRTTLNQTSSNEKVPLESVGVNTDISGPIKPTTILNSNILDSSAHATCLNINIPQTNKETTLPGDQTGISFHPPNSSQIVSASSSDLILISQVENKASKPYTSSSAYLLKNVSSFPDILSEEIPIRNPTFLDISSSSDSESNLKDHQNQGGVEETSADTTSLSVLMPKSLGANYILNVSSEESLSDSTFTNQPPIGKRIPRMSYSQAQISVGESSGNQDPNGKCFISSPQAGKEHIDQDNPDQNPAEEDSTENDSMAQSLMDSIHNKITDSLPRNDSELMHITEVNEDEYVVNNEDQQGHVGANKRFMKRRESSSSGLINDPESQSQEHCDNLSSFGGFQIEHKEAAQRDVRVEAEKENAEKHNMSRGEHQSPTGSSSFQLSSYKMIQDDQQSNTVSREPAANINSNQQTQNTLPQTSSNVYKKEDTVKEVKEKAEKVLKPGKRVHLKLDYDDSESEHSEQGKKPSKSGEGDKVVLRPDDKSKLQAKDLDEEFADFFD